MNGTTEHSRTKMRTKCRFYNTRGGCRYGDACRFSHSRENRSRNSGWTRVWTDKSTEPGDFKLMNLNLLAKSLVTRQHYYYCLNYIQWEYRRNLLLRHIREIDCDILCLQELDEDVFQGNFGKSLKRLNYNGYYKKRTGDKDDGCAIYYKESAFSLVCDPIMIEFKQPDNPMMDRDNVALALVLKPKKESLANQTLLVSTTHILFNPNRGDVKLSQIRYLLLQLKHLASLHQAKIVLTGDFNSTPDSAFYSLLFHESMNSSHLDRRQVSGQNAYIRCKPDSFHYDSMGHAGSGAFLGKFTGKALNCDAISDTASQRGYKISRLLPESLVSFRNPLQLSSAYSEPCAETSTGEPAITSYHSGFIGTVDYVAYERDKLLACKILELPKPNVFWQSKLPCKHWGSDHLSLCVEFRFCE
mmetsp:Transcript_3899/g.4361  ORF Transcript_3899/g.4361 Transcript_3899/m.4361 type:complete len:415 (+) Transcript_3899:2184-3428(+)